MYIFFGPEGKLSGAEETVKDSDNMLPYVCAVNGPMACSRRQEDLVLLGLDFQTYVPLFLKAKLDVKCSKHQGQNV